MFTSHARAAQGAAHPSNKLYRRGKIFTVRRRAAVRLAELIRLALFCRYHALPLDDGAFIHVACDALALQKRGLDYYSLVEFARKVGIAVEDDDATMHTIGRACARAEGDRHYRGIGCEWAAKLLALTAEVRRACWITTIGAIDETRAERQRRKAAEKLVRERARAKRAAAGCVIRAASLSRLRPWDATGVSRATWYRQRSAGNADPETKSSRTYVSYIVERRNCLMASPRGAVISNDPPDQPARERAGPSHPASTYRRSSVRRHTMERQCDTGSG